MWPTRSLFFCMEKTWTPAIREPALLLCSTYVSRNDSEINLNGFHVFRASRKRIGRAVIEKGVNVRLCPGHIATFVEAVTPRTLRYPFTTSQVPRTSVRNGFASSKSARTMSNRTWEFVQDIFQMVMPARHPILV